MEEYVAELGHPRPLSSSKKKEAHLRRLFPPLASPDEKNRFPVIEKPAVFFDQSGAVLAWSLSEIILPYAGEVQAVSTLSENAHSA